jgi:hypothetical protein
MPHTVAQLEKFGIPLRGRPFHGITYLDETHGSMPGSGPASECVRRTALHAALLEAARPPEFAWCATTSGPLPRTARRFAVGNSARYPPPRTACTRRSVARSASPGPVGGSTVGIAGTMRRRRGATGWGALAPGAEAYVTPVADDCVGVAILTSTQGGFDRHLTEFLLPQPISPGSHMGPTGRRVRCGSPSAAVPPTACCWSGTPPVTSTP